MIDFIKFQLIDHDVEALKTNEYLEFTSFLNENTGEISRYKFASFYGIKFKIYDSTSVNPGFRITVEGSLHKYWNKGQHNFNDFGYNNLLEVLMDLKEKFNIDTERCILKQIEFGVNIEPIIPSRLIIKHCLFHRTNMFKWTFVPDEGEYKQVKHQRYIVKVYNKQKHYAAKGYKINREILRFEVKFLKMIEFHKRGIHNLKSLIEFGMHNYVDGLVYEWEQVLFYDFVELDSTSYKDKYSNLNYWDGLKSENFKYHRNNMNKRVNKNPLNLKKIISNQILKKGDELIPKYYLN